MPFSGGPNTGCLQGAPERNLVCGQHFDAQPACNGINDAGGSLPGARQTAAAVLGTALAFGRAGPGQGDRIKHQRFGKLQPR